MLRSLALVALVLALTLPAEEASAAENSLSARKVFSLLPESIFENTIEGLDPGGKQELLSQGYSEFWELAGESADAMLFASLPFRESSVALRIFRHKNDGSVLAALGTMGGPVCTLELWRVDALGRIVPADTPAEPALQEFFAPENPIPPDVQGTVMICLGLNGLKAQPLFWTKTGMAHVPVDRDINFLWNGQNFEKDIARQEHSEGPSTASTPVAQ
jgi:hypothetical protein